MAAEDIAPLMAVDHGWCHSVYFVDPNGIMVELSGHTRLRTRPRRRPPAVHGDGEARRGEVLNVYTPRAIGDPAHPEELMSELIEVTSGLRFPEGPIAMPDGSIVLVEMFGPRLTRVLHDGTKETMAEIPGGPNGAALGPNGLIYLCNNGGRYSPVQVGDWLFPGPYDPARDTGGRIQTLDPTTGQIEDLYTECDGKPLWSPNDLVFDAHGGFYFTDHGLTDDAARIHHLSGIYYAAADGSSISEVVFPAHEPNGIGLSPDGSTLYWAQTWHGPDHAPRRGRAWRARRAGSRRSVRVPLRVRRAAVARLARRRRRRQRVRRHARQRRRLGRVAGR